MNIRALHVINRIAGLFLMVLGLNTNLRAGAVEVTFTVTPYSYPGNYLLDFSVTNNVPGQQLYFFGVRLSGPEAIVGVPFGYDPTVYPLWDNTPYGGTGVYNNNWIYPGGNGIDFGTTVSGFKAGVYSSVAPTSIDWFAYTVGFYDADYFGNDPGQVYFDVNNPGFEGTARVGNSVPDSASTIVLLGLAIAGLGFFRRKSQA